jgi:branched-chain amino acid transport system ATP-binding protein
VNLLELNSVTKKFRGLVAVERLNLSVSKGQTKSLIGPNGAGKTTAFNLISGALLPTSGEILFNGQKINGFPPHKLCHLGMARSFQITNIFQGLTVFENVRLSCQGKTGKISLFGSVELLKEQIEETKRILDLTGLSSKRDELAGNLSHGDQRHLEIGIALASRPTFLLLDEPTAGMNLGERRATIELIKRFKGALTILLIEHDIDLVFEVSDEIAVLHQGRLLAEGDPSEIKANKEVRKAYLGEESDA